jgi:(4-(4-[2-(gamma-L-glutamylamino)ethyl]phenoxymethyl)furan-2-yl)methanamine synthase
MLKKISTIAGIDIGGANIKYCQSDGYTLNTIFPLWKKKNSLPAILEKIIPAKKISTLAITMTGELCDCFKTKTEGVRYILNSIPKKQFTPLVWTTNQNFIPLDNAIQNPRICAASNWLGLASFIAKQHPENFGLSIDIGSTTTDVTSIDQGNPSPSGITDTQRLKYGELIYTGMKRTPMASLLGSKYAQEYFATISDAHLLVNNLEEDEEETETADGRSFTKTNSVRRIAKMLCADQNEIPMSRIIKTSELAIKTQIKWITMALKKHLQRKDQEPKWISISGSGETLAKLIIESFEWNTKPRVHSFSNLFGIENSSAACAYSIMKLAGNYHEL